jgi:prephenate dehydrogenase
MLFPPVPSEPLVQTLGIVGVGLIGGSIALAAQIREVASRVIGIRPQPRATGLRQGHWGHYRCRHGVEPIA